MILPHDLLILAPTKAAAEKWALSQIPNLRWHWVHSDYQIQGTHNQKYVLLPGGDMRLLSHLRQNGCTEYTP